MRKRTIAISLSILALAALAGGAYAASGSGSAPGQRPFGVSEQTILNDAAKRLHVSPATLTAALKGAAIDQVNALLKARHLPAAQANAIKQKLEHAPGLPLGLPFLALAGGFAGPVHVRAFGPIARQIAVPPGKVPPGAGFGGPGAFGPLAFFGPPAALPAAAHYLGLSEQALAQQLRSGKTLAQIATARGKSAQGLEQAIVTAFKSELAKAMAAQHSAEQQLVSGLTKQIQRLVNSKGPIGPLAVARSANFQGKVVGPPPIPALWFGLAGPRLMHVYAAPR